MGTQDAKSVFLHVIEAVAPVDWPSYLDAACGDDVGLRQSVERLLAHYRHDEDLAEQARELRDDALQSLEHFVAPPEGTQIGPYKVRERLGEGGMGVVYVAEQTEPVKRKVALKIIKPGMDSQQVIARFETERHTLAMMDHPNVARIIDAGTTHSGRSYFVMELVYGVPITEYCDEHQLGTDERLKVFLKVCRAVQHAHQKGIIHRDLKPSNVLVASIDGEAVPKVIDFGVAKAAGPQLTAESVYTQFSQLVGTPLYMSPEQAELGVADVDTRSDVYSLGVILYELMTGTTPFQSEQLKQAGFDEMRRIIREDDPPKPSAMVSTLNAEALSTVSQRRRSDPRRLTAILKGELDWLVMKALEKDRNRRYESASAFAVDVARYLVGEPIDACPPTLLYRARKHAVRYRIAYGTVGSVLLALLLGLAATSWQVWQTAKARSQAELNLELANRSLETANVQRSRTLASFRHARDTLDQFIAQVNDNPMLQNPEMQPLRDEFLRLARSYYQQFVDQEGQDPDLQADLADAYLRLADIAWALGDRELSSETHQQAVAIRTRLASDDPDNQDSQVKLALTLLAARVNRIENLQKTIAALSSVDRVEHRAALAKANNELAEKLLNSYISNSGNTDERDESLAAAHSAAELGEQLLKESPENADYKHLLLQSLSWLMWHSQTHSEQEEADAYLQRARKLLDELAQNPSMEASDRQRLAEAYYAVGQHKEAIAVNRQLLQEHPKTVQYELPLIDQYQKAADSSDEPIPLLQSAVDIARELSGRYPTNQLFQGQLGAALARLARAYFEAQQLEDAIRTANSAAEELTAVKPHLIGVLADAYLGLSMSHQAAGDLESAIRAKNQSLTLNGELRERLPGNLRFHSSGAFQLLELAELLHHVGRTDEALTRCQTAAASLQQVFAEGTPEGPIAHIFQARLALRDSHRDIGSYLSHLGRFDAAAEAYAQAIAAEAQMVRDVARSWAHESPNPLYDSFVYVCHQTGQDQRIEDLLRQELTTWQELEEHSAFTVSCEIRQLEVKLRLAEHLLSVDRPEEAAVFYREACSFLNAVDGWKQRVDMAIATCVYVCSEQQPSLLPACPERDELLAKTQERLAKALSEARDIGVNANDGEQRKWNYWCELALAFYRPQNWEGADREAQLVLKSAASRPNRLNLLLPLMLLAGKRTEYQSICSNLLNEYASSPLQENVKAVVKLGLLHNAMPEAEQIYELAQQASQSSADKHLVHVASYRTGDFDAAIEGLGNDFERSHQADALVALHLAVAHGLAGEKDESQSWLEIAAAQRSSLWKPEDRLTFEVLLDELQQTSAEDSNRAESL